jgi:hypothetical protein
MNNYQLTPKDGWEEFPKNVEVVESIYSLFIPLVNDGNWHYLNFTSDSGIFEDPAGNSVSLEFAKQSERTEIEKLESLNISIKDNDSSNKGFLETTMLDLAAEYGLEES